MGHTWHIPVDGQCLCKSALRSAFVERAHGQGGAKAFQRLCVRELCLLPLRARNLYGGLMRELCWF